MEETYSLGLALLDFVPNLAFLVGAYFLVRLALLARGWRCARMLIAGSLLVFAGGLLKALWKLLYSTGVADVRLFSELQFVLLAPGFLALLVSAILLARKRTEVEVAAPLLSIAPWKIPLLATMTLCSLGAQGILTYISFRRGARLAGAMFIVAVLCMLGMASMSSGEQTVARQWIEESINSVGQIAFAVGSFLLYRAVRAAGGVCVP